MFFRIGKSKQTSQQLLCWQDLLKLYSLHLKEFKCFFRTGTTINGLKTQHTHLLSCASTELKNTSEDQLPYCCATVSAMFYFSLSEMKSLFECQAQNIGLGKFCLTFAVVLWLVLSSVRFSIPLTLLKPTCSAGLGDHSIAYRKLSSLFTSNGIVLYVNCSTAFTSTTHVL